MDTGETGYMTQAWARDWAQYSASWRTALDDMIREHPECSFTVRAAFVVFAYETARRWAEDIAVELGFGPGAVWSDAQSIASFVVDATDEMFEIGVDVTDPDHIMLKWSTVIGHGGDPFPLPDYDTALAAAREHLELPEPDRAGLL